MSGVFGRLGIRRVINCMGMVTFLGGSPMDAEVIEAVAEAARTKVDLNELLAAAGRRIAELVEAPAAFVTTGAAGAMQLSAAACIAGTDLTRITRLPDAAGIPHDIVIHRKHRFNFDHALRNAGARLVEFGISHDTTAAWELSSALTPDTVAVMYVATYESLSVLALEEVIAISHDRDLPVIVDAAVTLPPRENLSRYVRMGADLVCYSGGKGIGGPQSTGFVVGRADLIEACRANASPNHNTVGRPLKVTAQDVAGLVVALERYLQRDEEAQLREWHAVLDEIRSSVAAVDGVETWQDFDAEHSLPIPLLYVRSAVPALHLAEQLHACDPSIRVLVRHGAVRIDPQAMTREDATFVASALTAVLAGTS